MGGGWLVTESRMLGTTTGSGTYILDRLAGSRSERTTASEALNHPWLADLADERRDANRVNEAVVESLCAFTKEAAVKKRAKLKKGEFHEEAFEEMTDTATIFSLRDYLTTPAFSADHLESERRKRRKRGKAS